jgi:hypothetical protein
VAAVARAQQLPLSDEALRDLRQALDREYPDLRLAVESGKLYLRGSFPVKHDGEILDRYQIEIELASGRFAVPSLREVGGRIPRDEDHHINGDGTACPLVPEEWLVRPASKRSLLDFLREPTHNYFLGQALVERGFRFPFGERRHRKAGLLEAYGEMLGLDDRRWAPAFLECLTHKRIRPAWRCPCGSGKLIRECHARTLAKLHDRIPRHVAESALERLRKTPV